MAILSTLCSRMATLEELSNDDSPLINTQRSMLSICNMKQISFLFQYFAMQNLNGIFRNTDSCIRQLVRPSEHRITPFHLFSRSIHG